MIEMLVDLEIAAPGNNLGQLTSDVWLDIETMKTPAPLEFPYKLRWKPFMVSMCGLESERFWLLTIAGDEDDLIAWLRTNLDEQTVRYSATRDFDEMVLRGRFTNARAALLNDAGVWPNMDDASINWLNIRKAINREVLMERNWQNDCLSRDVPLLWNAGLRDVVTRHCARDALQLFLADNEVKITAALRRELSAFMMNAEIGVKSVG
jgi:hypothetical protein